MVVINWVNKIQKCKIRNLSPIFEEVCRLMANFDSIICCHVYRERNAEADNLLNKGILTEQGTWKISETNGGEVYEFYHRPFLEPR